MLQFVRVQHEKDTGGLEIGDGGQLVNEEGAFLLAHGGIPKLVEGIHHRYAPNRRILVHEGFLDGTGPATHWGLPETAASQSGVKRLNRFGQTGQNAFRVARGKDDKPSGRLLPVKNPNGALHGIGKAERPGAGEESRDPRRTFWVQQLCEEDLGGFHHGGIWE